MTLFPVKSSNSLSTISFISHNIPTGLSDKSTFPDDKFETHGGCVCSRITQIVHGRDSNSTYLLHYITIIYQFNINNIRGFPNIY